MCKTKNLNKTNVKHFMQIKKKKLTVRKTKSVILRKNPEVNLTKNETEIEERMKNYLI